MHIVRNSGFSLVEAVVSAFIFTVAVAGIFASITSLKQPVANTDKSVDGALCGQEFLESLRASVDRRDWASSSSLLNPTAGSVASTCTRNGVTYSRNYTVTNQANGSRKVQVTVTWP